MRNATSVLPFKTHRPTRRHYFLRVNFRPFSFFMRTTRAKIIPASDLLQYHQPTMSLRSSSSRQLFIPRHNTKIIYNCNAELTGI